MRVDRVVRDHRRKFDDILLALDHNLTVRDNFAPEGTAGQVLISNGPDAPPSFQSIDTEAFLELLENHTHDGADIVAGLISPTHLGSGTRDGTRFLRDDGVWAEISNVAWDDITGKPTDFAGFGLDDDLAAVLANYSRVGHRHYYDELIDAPVGGGGLTLEDVRTELIGYAKIGHTHYYDSIMDTPPATPPGSGLTEEQIRVLLAPYSLIGHNHRIEEEAVAMEFILANQIFGG